MVEKVRPVQVFECHQTDRASRIAGFKYFSRHQAFTFQPLSVSIVPPAAEIQRSATRLFSKRTEETKALLYQLGRPDSCLLVRRQTSSCTSVIT